MLVQADTTHTPSVQVAVLTPVVMQLTGVLLVDFAHEVLLFVSHAVLSDLM